MGNLGRDKENGKQGEVGKDLLKKTQQYFENNVCTEGGQGVELVIRSEPEFLKRREPSLERELWKHIYLDSCF
jgi:hypothetical protein